MKTVSVNTFLVSIGFLFFWLFVEAFGLFTFGWFGFIIAIIFFAFTDWYNIQWIKEANNIKKKLPAIGMFLVTSFILLYLLFAFYMIFIQNESILH